MANPEHLGILKQGAEVWNKWWDENHGIKYDLSMSHLKSTDLKSAMLSGVNLRGAQLSMVYLVGADLRGAKLRKTDLSAARLHLANLSTADLRDSDLSKAKLIGAKLNSSNLSGADLIMANLSEADLTSAKLIGALMRGSDLRKADLRMANLRGADLTNTRLNEANLSQADLRQADLSSADLSSADLSRSQLQGARLNSAVLERATITGSNLWGTSHEGWKIDGIKCDFIFWDEEGKYCDPNGRTFAPAEFEKLYRDLPKFEYIFLENFTAIDIIVMDKIIQEINIHHPGHELKIDSFHHRGRPRAVFTIRDRNNADMIYEEIKKRYETQMKIIEAERNTYEKALAMVIKKPRTIIKRIEMGDTYEIKGQAGAVGPGAHAHDINFNQVWNDISMDVDLTKLSEELSILKEAVRREAKSSDQIRALADVSDAEAAAKAGKGSKVVEHLKNAGKWAFDVARDIGTNVAAEVIKKSLGI